MLQSLDLNLLPVLERLLATQSVTASAQALKLSPPAVSRALGRMRLMFGDDLLVKSGRRLVLTPRGEELRQQIGSCLGHVEALVQARSPLDLSQVERTMRIRCNDVFSGMLASRLLRHAATEGPGISISLLPEDHRSDRDPRNESIDMTIGGDLALMPEMIVRRVGDESLLGVVRSTHPLLQRKVTPRRFVSYPHVLANVQLEYEREMKDALSIHGLDRRTNLTVPTYFAAGMAASQSDLVASMPSVMAAQLHKALNLTSFRIPLSLPSIPVQVAWHPRFRKDPVHRWLRDKVIELVTESLQPQDNL